MLYIELLARCSAAYSSAGQDVVLYIVMLRQAFVVYIVVLGPDIVLYIVVLDPGVIL